MKVLICDMDVMASVGGGQRVYRRLALCNPEIEFHSFLNPKTPYPKDLPKNVVIRSWKPYSPPFNMRTRHIGQLMPQWIFEYVALAHQFAYQVAGESFDIVDCPDYQTIGSALKPAFDYFNVKVGKFALAMHGNCSTTFALEWPARQIDDVTLNVRESLQYSCADLRYSLSRRYQAEWQQLASEPVEYIDPLSFIELPTPIASWDKDKKCNLVFIGRPEKRKGPDIFLEVLKRIPKELYSKAMLVGPDSDYDKKITAKDYLKSQAKMHGIDLECVGSLNDKQLRELLSERSIVFTPSRYDTFNLVAIEALFAGCPTVIGSGAGVVDFLNQRIPELPYVLLDVDNLHTAVDPIVSILKNYDSYREDLNQKLKNLNYQIEGKSLSEIYNSNAVASSLAREVGNKWYAQYIDAFCEINKPDACGLRIIGNRLSRELKRDYQITTLPFDNIYEVITELPERKEDEILQKLASLWSFCDTSKIDRVRAWDEISRLERMRGNLNLSAAYRLRILRSLNQNSIEQTNDTIHSLNALGFKNEAAGLKALNSDSECLAYLESQYQRNLVAQSYEFAQIDDRRDKSITPKVSVIVSLYNAADKLEYFLSRLSEQTLIAQKQVEIILVDSASPKNEREAFERFHAQKQLSVLYVRSKNRETIQTAWNQGISLSTAAYLCFLGVDETLRPDALSILSNELDLDPETDWVTGDSTIYEVDKNGRVQKEVMSYLRQGYHQDLIQLETCYLSWVGALYRKSIHTRFGLYDGSFRAAGDTEFKNRILSRIKSKAIPQNLGIFLNYPEERTTQSCLAEIEDSRAWYIHRSPGGVRYTYQNRSASDLENQIIRCLNYRKSYMKTASTDFSYADSLLKFLEIKSPSSELLRLRPGVDSLLSSFRELELFEAPNAIRANHVLAAVNNTFQQVCNEHRQILGKQDLNYQVNIDNRYQQHDWPWKEVKSSADNKRGLIAMSGSSTHLSFRAELEKQLSQVSSEDFRRKLNDFSNFLVSNFPKKDPRTDLMELAEDLKNDLPTLKNYGFETLVQIDFLLESPEQAAARNDLLKIRAKVQEMVDASYSRDPFIKKAQELLCARNIKSKIDSLSPNEKKEIAEIYNFIAGVAFQSKDLEFASSMEVIAIVLAI